MPAFVDAEQLAKAWVNGLATLVGVGYPLVKGVHLHPRLGDQVTYAQIQVTGGAAALSAENPDHRAAVSFLVYGRTREATAHAATALANVLEAMTGAQPARVGDDTVLLADNVTAPSWSPDGPAPRYLVGCDLYLRAG